MATRSRRAERDARNTARLPGPKNPQSPFNRLLRVAELRHVDVGARASVSMRVIRVIAQADPEEVLTLRLEDVARVSLALGCAMAELVPMMITRPRKGLLWERGVFTDKKRAKSYRQNGEVTAKDVETFVGSLRRDGTPWASGCADVIEKLWAGHADPSAGLG